MKAIIKDDFIIKLIGFSNKGIEIGSLPKENGRNVGLDRLRWDGEKIVDLATLNEIWIDKKGLMHCYDIGGCTLIQMKFKDRKRLINDGTWRIKTKQEIRNYKNMEYARRRKHDFNKEVPIGDQLDEIMKYLKTKNDLTPELETIIAKVDDIKSRWDKPNKLEQTIKQ